MKTATSFGGPFVFIPIDLIDDWVNAMGEAPDSERGLYGKVCGHNSYMHSIPFGGTEVLRIAEDPSDLFWIPREDGGLIIQWIAAESLGDLIAHGEAVAESNQWEEVLSFEVANSRMCIMDSCGFDGDDQPKIDIDLSPGIYEVCATHNEGENTWATVFRVAKKREM